MNSKHSPLVLQVMEYIKQGRNIFITGGAGVGKSHLTKELLTMFESPLPLATTNLAAFHIKGGTIHKAFKLYNCRSIKEAQARDDTYIDAMMREGLQEHIARARFFKSIRDDIQSADVVFIDEISMLSAQIFDLFIYRLESLLGHRNIPIIVVGDLFQLPPVKSDNRKVDMVFKSKHWDFLVLELTKMKRTTDRDFTKVQNLIRRGLYTESVSKFIKEHSVEEEPDLKIMRLYPVLAQCDAHNRKMQRMNKGKLYKFQCEINNTGKIPKHQVEDYLKDMSADRTLEIKENDKILFISTKEGEYYNGEAGRVLNIFKNHDMIRIAKSNGVIIDVKKAMFNKVGYQKTGSKLKAKVELEVKQFPIKVSYAITIHKTQGMTIREPIFIDCHKIFEDSQFYVALSRASSPDNVILSGFDKSHIRVRKGIRQFYQEQEKLGNLIKINNY